MSQTIRNQGDEYIPRLIKDVYGIDLLSAQMDAMINQTMKIAKSWRHS